MKLENIMLNERSYAGKKKKRGHLMYGSIYMKHPGTGKPVETESRLVIARGWGKKGLAANGFLLGVMKIFRISGDGCTTW